jgi:hypothetical protein
MHPMALTVGCSKIIVEIFSGELNAGIQKSWFTVYSLQFTVYS